MDNHDVTLAVLATKMDGIETTVNRIEKLVSDQNGRVRTLEQDHAALKERVNIFQAGQATLTLLMGAVAAWLGGQR